MKVCIATPDILGPVRNGGVGTAFFGLAEALRDAGHGVTVFYTSDFYDDGDGDHWKAHFLSEHQLEFVPLGDVPKSNIRLQSLGGAQEYVLRSHRVYEYLKSRPDFDLLHFPDYLGLGYYCAMAKATGLAFQDKPIVVTTHGPSTWSQAYSYSTSKNLAPLVLSVMEKFVVEHADLVLSPSRFMLGWLKNRGWRLGRRSQHAFNALPIHTPQADMSELRRPRRSRMAVRELVFFGRIEQRKGIYLFIDAINQILDTSPKMLGNVKITFLGKANNRSVDPHLFGIRLNQWPMRWECITTYDASQALNYLGQPGRVAIIPSLMDNSPCTILECLYRRIPFVTTNVGGSGELIVENADLPKPHVTDVSRKLLDILQRGHRPYTPVCSPGSAAAALVLAHERVGRTARRINNKRSISVRTSRSALVSVCIVHRDRPAFLKAALDGFAQQRFRGFEVVIADNGSHDRSALAFLTHLEQTQPYDFAVKVVRMGYNAFPGPARNAAARAAGGSILKFHDDDNIPKEHEIATFVRALEGGFDVVTCALDIFYGDQPIGPGQDQLLFLGDGGALSLMHNVIGDANFAIRKSAFEEIGGFDDIGFLYHAEDWLFLAKAQARGLKIATIPDPLVWYRSHRDRYQTNWRKRDIDGARFRVSQAFASGYPESVGQMMRYLSTVGC